MIFRYSLGEWVQVDSGRFGKIVSREIQNSDPVYGVHLVSSLDPHHKFNILVHPPGAFDTVAVWEHELIPKDPPRVNQVEFEKWKRSQDKQHQIQTDLWKRKLGPGDEGKRNASSRSRDADDDPWSQLDMDDFEWMIFKVLSPGRFYTTDRMERDLDTEVRKGVISVRFLIKHKVKWWELQDSLAEQGHGRLRERTNFVANRSFAIDLAELLERRKREARELGVLPKRLGGTEERI